MEFIGEVDSLDDLCKTLGIEYPKIDGYAQYRNIRHAGNFIDNLAGYPKKDSPADLYKAGAKGELQMLGKFDFYLNEVPAEPVPAYMILGKALPTYEGLNDTYRVPDAIFICGHGVAVISVKYWADHFTNDWYEKKLKPALKQLGATARGLDRILRKDKECIARNSVAVLYDPNSPTSDFDLTPFGGVGMHYTNSVMEIIRDIMPTERTVMTPEEMEKVKDYILNYYEEEEVTSWSAYDEDDFPTMEEIEQWEEEEG